MKRWARLFFFSCLIVLSVFSFSSSAEGAAKGWQTENGYTYYYKANGSVKTGWMVKGGKTYYFRREAEENKPKGSMVTGFCQIGDDIFYFQKSTGVMQTGWKMISGNVYYFKRTGDKGVRGRMASGGRKHIGSHYYYFDSNGVMQTGWQKIRGKRYYFKRSGALGTKGKSYSGWKKIGNYKYYFAVKGYVYTGWQKKTIDKYTYYFSAKGRMQTGWQEIDGKTYYFNSSGRMQTGWQTISGSRYYFNKKGVMQRNKTVDGVKLDENGVAEKTCNVLIVAGHGQGDPGATSTMKGTYYQESTYTREFATLIYNKLKASGKSVNVTMYNQNYDWYQVNAGTKSGPKITWSNYDYILEVHFNASGTASKDYSGNGSYKGLGIYVSSSSSKTKIDKAIISSIKSETGFKIWGGGSGIFYDSSLLNPKLAQQHGVAYGLLETCFIDDYDDMKYYRNNKNKMAQAVADGIISGLGL